MQCRCAILPRPRRSPQQRERGRCAPSLPNRTQGCVRHRGLRRLPRHLLQRAGSRWRIASSGSYVVEPDCRALLLRHGCLSMPELRVAAGAGAGNPRTQVPLVSRFGFTPWIPPTQLEVQSTACSLLRLLAGGRSRRAGPECIRRPPDGTTFGAASDSRFETEEESNAGDAEAGAYDADDGVLLQCRCFDASG